MFCPKCGKELPDTAKFCGNCGHKFEESGNVKRTGAMTKKLIIVALGCLAGLSILVCFDPFHIRHDWQEATCTEPAICSKCEKTKGEALGHMWEEATCIQPKTCSRCGETEGKSSREHLWEEATCTQPETCSRCGKTFGESLGGHLWEEATCTQPKTCSRCGETEGEPLGGHLWEKATCTQPKTCSRCGETEGKPLGHCWGSTNATCMELKTCDRCHMDGFLGRHRMNESTGVCEICGKELRIALNDSNWKEYLVHDGLRVYPEEYLGVFEVGTDLRDVQRFHYQNIVVEAKCEVIKASGVDVFTGEGYSIRDVQRFRINLNSTGMGDFQKAFPNVSMSGRCEIISVSGFVIFYEDEYERRHIKERDDL